MASPNAHASKTNEVYRDLTRTPQWLFDAFNSEFDYQIDAAALPESALLPVFFTPHMDGLSMPWRVFGERVWVNPPYSVGQIKRWLLKAIAERDNGVTTTLLIPHDNRTEWYHWCTHANEIRDIVGYYDEAGKWNSGGIRFIDAETGEEMPHELNKPMMLVVFEAHGKDRPVQYTTVTKKELLEKAHEYGNSNATAG